MVIIFNLFYNYYLFLNSVRPGGGFVINNQGFDDDDFFHGDFALLNKPHNNILNSACGVIIVSISRMKIII